MQSIEFTLAREKPLAVGPARPANSEHGFTCLTARARSAGLSPSVELGTELYLAAHRATLSLVGVAGDEKDAEPVFSDMIAMREHDEVLDPVVVLDAVDVVNQFVAAKLSPEMFLHDKPVLLDALPPALHDDVPLSVPVDAPHAVGALMGDADIAPTLPAPVVHPAPPALLGSFLASLDSACSHSRNSTTPLKE